MKRIVRGGADGSDDAGTGSGPPSGIVRIRSGAMPHREASAS
jgi:hypothetical protein